MKRRFSLVVRPKSIHELFTFANRPSANFLKACELVVVTPVALSWRLQREARFVRRWTDYAKRSSRAWETEFAVPVFLISSRGRVRMVWRR